MLNNNIAAKEPAIVSGAPRYVTVLISFVLFLLPISAHSSTLFNHLSIILLLASLLFLGQNWRTITFSPEIKLFIAGSLAFPLANALNMLVSSDWQAMWFDNPSRLILVLPVFLLMQHVRVSLIWLVVGILVSACLFGFTAVYQHYFLGIGRVNGWITELRSPITFGNAALLFSILSVSTLPLLKQKVSIYWAAFFVLLAAGLAGYASLLSGTRGGWVSVPFLLVVLLSTGSSRPLRANLVAICVAVVVLVGAYLSIDSVAARTNHAWNEVVSMVNTGAFTGGSVGTRLEMWWAAVLLFVENPIWGVGLGHYYEAKLALIDQGIVSNRVARFGYAHSEPFHYLAEMGLMGVLPLFGFYLSGFWLVLKNIKFNKYLATMALLVLVLRFDIGLTQVQFVYHYTTILYAMMFAVLAGLMCNPCFYDTRD